MLTPNGRLTERDRSGVNTGGVTTDDEDRVDRNAERASLLVGDFMFDRKTTDEDVKLSKSLTASSLGFKIPLKTKLLTDR